MGKEKKKKKTNVLTAFSFSIKVMSKFSLIELLMSVLRALVSISLKILYSLYHPL